MLSFHVGEWIIGKRTIKTIKIDRQVLSRASSVSSLNRGSNGKAGVV